MIRTNQAARTAEHELPGLPVADNLATLRRGLFSASVRDFLAEMSSRSPNFKEKGEQFVANLQDIVTLGHAIQEGLYAQGIPLTNREATRKAHADALEDFSKKIKSTRADFASYETVLADEVFGSLVRRATVSESARAANIFVRYVTNDLERMQGTLDSLGMQAKLEAKFNTAGTPGLSTPLFEKPRSWLKGLFN